MEFGFQHPWFLVGALVLSLLAMGVGVWRKNATVTLFVMAGAFFIGAAAMPWVTNQDQRTHHALVIDVSDSMAARADDARALADGFEPNDDNTIARYELNEILHDEPTIAGGVARMQALAGLADDTDIDGEIVFVTDGRVDAGRLFATVPTDRLTLVRAPNPSAPDVVVTSFDSPQILSKGYTGLVRGAIRSDLASDVTWRLYQDDRVVDEGSRSVEAGDEFGVSHSFVAGDAALIRFRLEVEAKGDRETRNNSARVATRVNAGRVVWYAKPSELAEGADALLQTLRADSLNEVRVESRLPASIEELNGVALVVIHDLPLSTRTGGQQSVAMLAHWVKDGGSVLMAGCDSAFAPGGYRNTPIESLMPVRFTPKDEPSRTTLVLLDGSSSMSESVGGQTKLAMLKDAARRVASSLPGDDRIGVVGFQSSLLGTPQFIGANNTAALETMLADLSADGSTNIHRALNEASSAIAPEARKRSRIVLVSDGEDMSAAKPEDWATTAKALGELQLVLVLTTSKVPSWAQLLFNAGVNVSTHTTGDTGFASLADALNRAMQGMNKPLVLTTGMEVGGIPHRLTRMVRCAPRNSADVTPLLDAQTPRTRTPWYPLLYTRRVGGRTLALCMPMHGDESIRDFVSAPVFVERLGDALEFLFENALRPRLILRPDGEQYRLVWMTSDDPPVGDLRSDNGAVFERLGQAEWRVKSLPRGDDMGVYDGDTLIQRLALRHGVPPELRHTGNDEAFFSIAESRGVRVLNSASAWKPRRTLERKTSAFDLTWLLALIGVACMIVGFAKRKPDAS